MAYLFAVTTPKTVLKKFKAKAAKLKKKKKKAAKAEEPETCARSTCWERSNICRGGDAPAFDQSVDPEFLLAADDDLPQSYKKAGITCRVPAWRAINQSYNSIASQAATKNRRHSDAVYASFCSKLMKVINGPARSWATYEFFYSDLDRAW